MKNNPTFKLSTLSLAMLSGSLLLTVPNVMAADNVDSANEIERISVTGSRIARAELVGASPVTVIDRAQIDASGAIDIASLLQEIPAVNGASQSTNRAFSGGTATVALRGLSSTNTLVLINGRRLSTVNPAGTVDLNNIPFGAIERVEVLQDGASAVYGSDAIAGVVNIIMKSDYDGFEIQIEQGQSAEGDADRTIVDMTFGAAFDKGNFIVSANRTNKKTYIMSTRKVTADTNRTNYGGVDLSDPIPDYSAVVTHPDGGQLVIKPGSDRINGWNDLDNFDWGNPEHTQNYWDYMTAGVDTQRDSIWTSGNYELSDSITGYYEFNYTHAENQGKNQIQSPLDVWGEGVAVSATNPYNPFGEDVRVGRAMWEITPTGKRHAVNNVTNDRRYTLGLNGELGGWDWDVSYTSEKFDSTNHGIELSSSRLAAAAGDEAACAARNDGCVSIDLFGRRGTVTPEMVNYVSEEGVIVNEGSMNTWMFNTSGAVFELPAGSVYMAVGAEMREEMASTNVSRIYEAGDTVFGGGSADTMPPEPREVKEVYAEAIVPVITDVFLIDALEFDFAIRYSDYSDFGDTTNPKVGMKWRPVADVLVRGSWSEGFRAPGLSQLYGGQTTGYNTGAQDPCRGDDWASFPGCAQKNPTELPGAWSRSGGEPTLQPETAESTTLGFVWTPEFLEGFSVTVDYFNIKKENLIFQPSTNEVLKDVANAGGVYDPAQVERNPDGTIKVVRATLSNVGSQNIEGMDYSVGYTLPSTEIGDFKVFWGASQLKEYSTNGEDKVGLYYAESGTWTEWRHSIRASWALDDVSVSYNSNYTGSVTQEENSWAIPEGSEHLKKLDGYIVHNVQAAYNIDSINTKVSVGIENFTDQDPQVALADYRNGYDGFGSQNSIGRYYYLRLNMQF
ncbi:MAG: TonB-dependent receptor [Colwellia sp.]|uniref:TonB-dependent receptor n=1 Tax=Colwellia sp. TaxID=56799 RepID=UPI001D7313AC|nr:TonB-dependent receptor [Colwellia sp.]NQY49735.1 TonB-dependent receptor [Colwellia sp.]